jgi:hypothetical protein
MTPKLCAGVAASALLILISGGGTAFAQKPGGILKMYSLDSPPMERTPLASGRRWGCSIIWSCSTST